MNVRWRGLICSQREDTFKVTCKIVWFMVCFTELSKQNDLCTVQRDSDYECRVRKIWG
jgi:hypothetical protein